MTKTMETTIFRVKTEGFHGELFRPAQDNHPGKALICFSGSDGRFELSRMLAAVFQEHGLTALALAYVMEEGLPNQFYHVPIDPLETAARRLHEMGYEKVGLWGISKGAELALTAGSLLPEVVNGVVAVCPVNTVCQGFEKQKGIRILPGSSWSFRGKPVPYTPFRVEKLPVGEVLLASLRAGGPSMDGLYRPLVERPRSEAVIPVERIGGPILLISSRADTMWPSQLAAERIMERLESCGFPYPHRHLSYEYGSHLFVPLELRAAKFFRADRGRLKEKSRQARMDSLEQTLAFLAAW